MIFTFTFNDFHDLIELEMISHEKKINISNEKEYQNIRWIYLTEAVLRTETSAAFGWFRESKAQRKPTRKTINEK